MPRSVEEIQNDIAKVKAEIALKNKYMNGYAAPTSNRGWGAYFQGDKSVHQKALDEQTTWANNDLNRALQEKLARINSDKSEVKSEADLKREAREKMRDQMEYEQAQADYDAAMDALDSENPQTALAAQRAAIKLNYALRNVYPDTDNQGLASFFNAPDANLEDLIGRAYYEGKSSPRITKARNAKLEEDYEIAMNEYNAAQEEVTKAENAGYPLDIAAANRKLDLAKSKLNKLGQKLGKPEIDKLDNMPEMPALGISTQAQGSDNSDTLTPDNSSLDARLSSYRAINSFETDSEKNKVLTAIRKDPNYKRNSELQKEYERLKKLESKEAANKKLNKQISDAIASDDPGKLPEGYSRRTMEDNKRWVVKKNKDGNYDKVQPWR